MKKKNVYKHERFTAKQRRKRTAVKVAAAVFAAAVVGAVGFVLLKPYFDATGVPTAKKITDSTVTLEWNRVSKAKSYNIYWKKTSGAYKKVSGVKNNTYTLKNLSQTTEYKICVSAMYKSSESDKSAEQTVYTLAESPNAVDARSQIRGSIKIQWNSNPEALSYTVQYKKAADKNYSAKNTLTLNKSSDCKTRFLGLDAGEKYDVRVRAVTSYNGKSVNGCWSTVRTEAYKRKLDPKKPMIALTFDDGPSYGKASKRILDTLEKYDAKATFFMVGNRAEEFSANVRRKAELGMELGNHSWDHTKMGESIRTKDITKCSDAIKKITGFSPTALRPPEGVSTPLIEKECKNENMPIFLWNVDTNDWNSRDTNAICTSLVNSAEDGSIVLMHEIYDSTAAAVEKAVPKLKKQGYQFVTCTELIEAKTGKPPKAGKVYYSAGQ